MTCPPCGETSFKRHQWAQASAPHRIGAAKPAVHHWLNRRRPSAHRRLILQRPRPPPRHWDNRYKRAYASTPCKG